MLKNKLRHNTVVATSMSNMGLEKFLTSQGLKLLRTDVGDRYVVEQMQKNGINLGGEQSGHVIFSDFSTTGDGLIASLQFLAAMQGNRSSASELLNLYEPYPQLLENVKIDQSNDPLGNSSIQKLLSEKKNLFNEFGRIVIRKSGTEPLIRVMGEHEDFSILQEAINEIVQAIKRLN